MTFPNVADLSSAQGSFDAAAYAASGRQAVIIKSTESTNYHFVTGDTWELQARQHGLVVGRYHWCGSSTKGTIATPNVEGDWFLKWNGEHTPGRFAAGDMEDPLPGHGPPLYGMSAANAAAWLDEFLDYIAAKGGWPGLGYSFSGSGVVQRIRHAKWPASYPKLTVPDAALHQFSSSAPVPGVGNCDDSHCFVDLQAFAGSSAPGPTPAPDLLEEDMPTITIPAPDANSEKDEKGNAFEKGTVPCLAGTKGLVYVSSDPWPDTVAPGVRIAVGTGRPDANGNRDHWRVSGGPPPHAVPVANFPIVLSYDATQPWTAGPHGDEQASVWNYGPGEVTLTTQPTS